MVSRFVQKSAMQKQHGVYQATSGIIYAGSIRLSNDIFRCYFEVTFRISQAFS